MGCNGRLGVSRIHLKIFSKVLNQWSFRFSKAFFKVSGYLYHKLLGEELSWFSAVTASEVSGLTGSGMVARSRCRTTDDSSGSFPSWVFCVFFFRYQKSGANLWGANVPKHFTAPNLPQLNHSQAELDVFHIFLVGILWTHDKDWCFEQEQKRGLLMVILFWKATHLIFVKAAVVTNRELHVHAMFLSGSISWCVGLCGAQSIVESPVPYSGTSRHHVMWILVNVTWIYLYQFLVKASRNWKDCDQCHHCFPPHSAESGSGQGCWHIFLNSLWSTCDLTGFSGGFIGVFCVWELAGDQVLVCAPSNIAVDQLAEKLHKTGLKAGNPNLRTSEVSAIWRTLNHI